MQSWQSRPLSAKAADGKALYEKDCASAMEPMAKAKPGWARKYGCKDYTDAKVQDKLKDEAAAKAIKDGYTDKEGKVVMKPAEGLSDDDVKALVAYMRSFKK